MLSSVLKYASSKHMYGVPFWGLECRRTISGVSWTLMDWCLLITGLLVGNVPHFLLSPNMLPKQLERGAPLMQQINGLVLG